MDSELPMNALGNATALRGRHKGLIFHSDRGSRYSSRKYREMPAENGIAVSDAVTVLRTSMGIASSGPNNADVNGNGAVDAADAIMILRFAMGLL